MVSVSENGLQLIKWFEGKHTLYTLVPELKAYTCPAGVITIGWGTTRYPDGSPIKAGDTCSVQDARRYLLHDVKKLESEIIGLVGTHISQNQIDSLISFVYNVGIGALRKSTLLRVIKQDAPARIVTESFLMWSKANGGHNSKDDDGDGVIDELGEKQTLTGLYKRRMAEAILYTTGKLDLG